MSLMHSTTRVRGDEDMLSLSEPLAADVEMIVCVRNSASFSLSSSSCGELMEESIVIVASPNMWRAVGPAFLGAELGLSDFLGAECGFLWVGPILLKRCGFLWAEFCFSAEFVVLEEVLLSSTVPWSGFLWEGLVLLELYGFLQAGLGFHGSLVSFPCESALVGTCLLSWRLL